MLTNYPGVGQVAINNSALISEDGAGLISAADAKLISQDGGGLISQDGGGIVSHDSGGIVSHDSGGVISNDGGSVISNDGGSLAGTGATGLFTLNGLVLATRSYTLTGDPGVTPAAPPVAAPEQVVSPVADGTAVRNTPAVAALSNGKYVTAWREQGIGSDGHSFTGGSQVRGQMLNADDTPFGPAFTIASPASPVKGGETEPGVTGLAGGRFVVTWTDRHLNQPVDQYQNTNSDVLAQFYNANGTANGPAVTVNASTYADQDQGAVASLFTGGAVVVFRSDVVINGSIYTSQAKLLGQRYAADGTAVSGNFAIGPAVSQNEMNPFAAGLQDGGFVVAYTEQGGTYPNLTGTIFMQRFTAAGASAGVPVQVNTSTAGLLDKPSVAVLADGTFVVAWLKDTQYANTTSGSIFAQRFSATGAPLGGEILVTSNLKQFGLNYAPALSALHEGGYAIVWNNNNTSTTGETSSDLRGQVFSADGTRQGGTFAANPNPADYYNYQYADPAATTLSDGRLILDATRLNFVTKPSSSQDVRAELFNMPTTATTPTTYGRVIDGIIKGATVFADANGNGKLDAGEATATTDAKGRFTFTTPASGPVIATGGTDVSTGLPFTGTFTAPAGSLSVTALSTLVQKVMASNGSSVGEAMARVAVSLGLSLKTDMTSFNPITATLNSVADANKALVADAVVMNTLTLAKAAGATGDLYGLLASQIAAASYGTVDPTSPSTLQALGLDVSTALDVSKFAKAGADLLAAKLASGESARTLVNDVTGGNTVLQGVAARDLAAGEASGNIGPVVTKYTGDNLTAQVAAGSAAAAGTPYGFAYTDVTTSGIGYTNGDAYNGLAAGLQHQYIWAGTDKVAIAATAGNVFLHGGSGDDALLVTGGTNVLDGGAGSNFLVGGTGAGSDMFLLDGRGGAATWSTIVNFHQGDAVTLFGFNAGVSTAPVTALDGTAGFQGWTIHSELGGAGTGVNASMTLAGIEQATADAHLTITSGVLGAGTSSQTGYLYIQYNR